MITRLDVGEDEDPDRVRKELDGQLGVSQWRVPGAPEKEPPKPEDEGAPWWWTDDEEASQGFLKEMGVVLNAD